MNLSALFLSVVLLLTISFNSFAQGLDPEFGVLTEEMAEELGMTAVEDIGRLRSDNKDEGSEWKTGPDEHKAEVVLMINKAPKGKSSWAQRLRVYYKGELLKTFTVSTGRESRVTATSGKSYIASTPLGYFRPNTIWKEYQSTTWVGATMNNPIFFRGGIAVHATTPNHFKELGGRASGGCVRLHPDHAKIVNELVLETGNQNYEIKDRHRYAGKRKIIRNMVVGGDIPILGVYRDTGRIYNETLVKSWDTLIIVKDERD